MPPFWSDVCRRSRRVYPKRAWFSIVGESGPIVFGDDTVAARDGVADDARVRGRCRPGKGVTGSSSSRKYE